MIYHVDSDGIREWCFSCDTGIVMSAEQREVIIDCNGKLKKHTDWCEHWQRNRRVNLWINGIGNSHIRKQRRK